jgi:hypothetical protein
MTRSKFYSDNAAPCWKCGGTIVEYVTDDTVSLIDVLCISCRNRDVFSATGNPDTAAAISAAHRLATQQPAATGSTNGMERKR